MAVELVIDHRSDMAGGAHQGVEGRQFVLLAHQLLDGDIDEVGQILLRPGRFAHGQQHRMARLPTEYLNVQRLANDLQMSFARSGEIVSCQFGESGLGLCEGGDMFDDGGRHLAEQRKVSQALKGLEQNEKAEVRAFPTGALLGQCQLVGCRGIDGSQIAGGDDALQPRIGGFLNGGQGI